MGKFEQPWRTDRWPELNATLSVVHFSKRSKGGSSAGQCSASTISVILSSQLETPSQHARRASSPWISLGLSGKAWPISFLLMTCDTASMRAEAEAANIASVNVQINCAGDATFEEVCST